MEEHKRRVVKTIRYQTAVADKKTEKIYTVTVRYMEVSEQEAETKLSIIKGILKNSY